ncbi:DMT family transporter [Phaeospirillum tilakii]|uniref:DMT family transporter n=1 Tax=Phaeospirillum tilakii TaxID=741673 RepID=A0ABW5CAM8_9PROT
MGRLAPIEILAAIAVSALWGGNMVAIKAAVATLPPFLLTGIRFVIVAALLLPWVRPKRGQWRLVALLALVLGVGHFGLLFLAVRGMDAAAATVAVQLSIPFSALVAWVAYREPLGWRRGAGLGLAFAGVALLAGEPHAQGIGPLLVMAVSTLCWALSNLVVKRIGPIDPLALNGGMALVAAPLLLILSALVEQDQAAALAATDWRGWAGLAYIVVGASLVAYSLWYWLVRRHALNKVVPYTLLGPAVGITGGVLLLGEPLTWHKLAGGVLTVAGVAVVQLWTGSARGKS